jgi:hypothetical protein
MVVKKKKLKRENLKEKEKMGKPHPGPDSPALGPTCFSPRAAHAWFFLSAWPSREDCTHQRCCAADKRAQPGGYLIVLPQAPHVAHLLTTSSSWDMHVGCAWQHPDPNICGVLALLRALYSYHAEHLSIPPGVGEIDVPNSPVWCLD